MNRCHERSHERSSHRKSTKATIKITQAKHKTDLSSKDKENVGENKAVKQIQLNKWGCDVVSWVAFRSLKPQVVQDGLSWQSS